MEWTTKMFFYTTKDDPDTFLRTKNLRDIAYHELTGIYTSLNELSEELKRRHIVELVLAHSGESFDYTKENLSTIFELYDILELYCKYGICYIYVKITWR